MEFETEWQWHDTWQRMQLANQHYSLAYEKSRMLYQVAQTIPKDGLIVELGVCHGSTALMLASIIAKKPDEEVGGLYIGVDDWSLEGSRDEVERLLRDQGLWHCATLQEGKTSEVALPEEPIDLLVIDAGHDPENVKADCARWIPLVPVGGLVAFDDCPPQPAIKLVSQYARDLDPHWGVRWYADLHTQDWDMVGYWGGLLVRRRPE